MQKKIKAHELEIDRIQSSINRYRKLAWSSIFIGLLLALIGFIAFCFDSEKMFNLNLIGDYIGGVVGSLWALASIFLIYIAFLGQQMSNIYQQIELLITKKDFEEHRKDVKSQTLTFKKQQFENTFFNLINLIHSHRINIEMANAKGVKCFYNVVEILEASYSSIDVEDEDVKVDLMFKKVPKISEGLFNSYVRSCIETYNFIDSQSLSDTDMDLYHSIYFSQFSEKELLFLFYILGSEHNKSMRKKIESFLPRGNYLIILDRLKIQFNQLLCFVM